MVIQRTPTKIDKIVSLRIGQHQENAATQIKMDVSDWITVHPTAGFHILFKRPGEVQAQPVLSSLEEGILTWTVQAWETALIGVGYAEVRAIEAESALVAKSRVIPCSVEESIAEDGDVPPEYSGWVERVLEVADLADDLEQSIADGIEDIQAEGATQVGNVNTAGTTQVGNVNTAGTTQVGNVNTAGTTQVGAVQAKGEEVLNSIPADYSTLSGDVTGLKRAFSSVTEIITEPITITGKINRIEGKTVAPISVSGQGESETVYVTSANLFDISLIPDRSGLVVNHGTYLTITQNSSGDRVNCLKKLSELCPQIKVGDTVFIKADTTGSNKYVYFNLNSQTVVFGQSFVVTQNFLDSFMYFLASGASTSADISNIMVCFDVTDAYEEYDVKTYTQGQTVLENDINYVFGSLRNTLDILYSVSKFDGIQDQIDGIKGTLTKESTITGEIIHINDALSGNVISLAGASNGEKIYVGSHNLFNISAIPDRSGYIVNNGNSLTITQPTSGAVNTLTKLKDVCPGLRVGDVATLNATTSGIREAYLSSGNSWVFGTRLTITQAMLDGYLYLYANGEGTTITVSEIQIWFGKSAGTYENFKTKEYTYETDTVAFDNGLNIVWSSENSTLTLTYQASTIAESEASAESYARWKGKNVLVLGDSISTDNYLTYPSWATLMGNYFGMNLINPSVHAVGYLCGVDTATPNENSLVNLLETLHTQYPNEDDFDLIVFFRGTNDFGNNIPIGSSGDSKTASFTGAVEWCFKYAVDNWSKARIVVFTPMQRITGQRANSTGAVLKDYADVIRNKAHAIGFDVLDLFNISGFSVLYNPFGEYTVGYNDFAERYCLETPEHNPDGLHPNKLFTDTRLSPMVNEFIKGV